ncbi:MAG: ComEC/Rec2 family competence protein [Dolichospermum sp. DET50]|nr:ComEC/Rec2 family competence protein [Dolichospermum sp. DET66]MBS3035183.1 ComEC/Rec2 family competence protein [Dolichospermum sp. DET67]MBS3040383.1 ComEC/Rec2 family competence protein [Dolichospermum sp. DET50]QSX67533.1 MAG: ComEC/Rec2 family competence protein [Dolichospermum sp. DET69]
MMQTSGVIICLSYILGLLFTAIPWGGIWILLLGIVGAVLFRRIYANLRKFALRKENAVTKQKAVVNNWAGVPHPRIWLIAGVVGLLATVYFQFRVPQPGIKDISQFAAGDNSNLEQLVIVRGLVDSNPRVTRSQRGQFWLAATQLDEVKNDQGPAGIPKGVTGRLYVTVPILQSTGLYPGQQIAVTGFLYKPTAASNPGAFDFQKYLRGEGTFAGLIGRQINILDDERPWGWWQVREKIGRSQASVLGIPEGPLVSAMVLGGKAVDLPYDIRDLFVKAGLAHALAASGFQTSLILGVILQLTKRANKATQITLGSLGLITFLFLSGFQPPVLRAVIMGFAALLGLALERNVKQLGSLLIAATLLLLFNPLWIWDLGFQLSFLATLGLIVTASSITQRLDWLPPAIASLISIPLAATIWTLPRLLEFSSVIPIYSVPLNILTTPFISIISIGGMISGLASLISPNLGGTLAGFLYYPTHWLIQMVEFFANLPGSLIAVGSISIWQMLIIYILIILAWLVRWWQQRWWFAGLMAFGLVVIPVWHSANNLVSITLLETRTEPVLVIQDKGNISIINSGNEGTGRFTILPFLRQQGINQINWAIASKFPGYTHDAWLEILQNLPIKNLYEYTSNVENNIETQVLQQELQKQQGIYQNLALRQPINTPTMMAQLINDQVPILKLQVLNQNWLLVGNIKSQQIQELIKSGDLSSPQVLWCPSESLQDLVLALKPQIAISSANNLDNKTLSSLSKGGTKLFFTGKDGAIQWTPNGDFQTFIQTTENKSSAL